MNNRKFGVMLLKRDVAEENLNTATKDHILYLSRYNNSDSAISTDKLEMISL